MTGFSASVSTHGSRGPALGLTGWGPHPIGFALDSGPCRLRTPLYWVWVRSWPAGGLPASRLGNSPYWVSRSAS